MSLFSSLKIIDLSRVFSGPFATRHFAEYGAQVLKIESPTGDESRHFPPLIGEWSGYFELLNHNKQSLTLDLKNESHLQELYHLCKDADVFVENFTPKVKKRLGIDYETISHINPQMIYASISGVSEEVDRKYYDVIAQAESGLISLNGERDDMKISTSIVDTLAGMKLAYAISSALFARTQTKKGTHIVVSMKGVAFDLLEQNLIETSVTGKNPQKVGNMDSAIAPFGIFKTQEGSIAIAIGNDALWERFETFLQKYSPAEDLSLFIHNEQRLQHLAQLRNWIERVFSLFDTKSLSAELSAIGIPCGEVKTMLDVLSDQENVQQHLLQRVTTHTTEFVVPTGGISFSNYQPIQYIPAPTKT